MRRLIFHTVIYFLAGVLLIIRADWWWWGEKIYPLIGGWLSIPMIYQLLIWLCGYILVILTVYKLWDHHHN